MLPSRIYVYSESTKFLPTVSCPVSTSDFGFMAADRDLQKVEDKSEMRNPPHRLTAGLRLTVRLTQFRPFMLGSVIYILSTLCVPF